MKSAKAKPSSPGNSGPVWCHRCCIRIAPYDTKTVYHGKDYHRDCYVKLNLEKGRKN